MIKQVRFRVYDYWLQHGNKDLGCNKWDLCSNPVYEIFDIPRDAKIVWLTAHKRPGVNRVEVKLITVDESDCIAVEGIRRCWFMNTKYSIIRLLKKHGTFYVSAEYTT